ncbi:MAG: carbon-nitrogen hydrolase family protein [Treponema sp.]|jgi:predicted amidohydrolase|nr:carbon-nitrogen hydrolase family protein [Treponema sp.]
MKKFTVALLQLTPTGNQSGNLEKGIEACRSAKERGADLALFPEMWNIGYHFPSENIREGLRDAAIDADGDFIKAFQAEAAALNMAIGVTYLERWVDLPRNALTVIDRFGNRVLTYAKVHTCDFDNEVYLTSGDDFYVADLHTEGGEIKIGAMICYDREFPESARVLMLKGAEVILVPNACPIEINRESQLRARAFENMVGVAMANYAGGKVDCNGHSQAYDGMAYGEIVSGNFGARDMLIVRADEAEGIYMAEFDIETLRAYRKREVWGNAYRKPHTYSLLTHPSGV